MLKIIMNVHEKGKQLKGYFGVWELVRYQASFVLWILIYRCLDESGWRIKRQTGQKRQA
jgi:hypothetical protein